MSFQKISMEMLLPLFADEGPTLLMVLALKSAIVTRKNLTATQKTYLSEVFQEKHTGQKADPVNIL